MGAAMIDFGFEDFPRFARDSGGARVEYPAAACDERPALRLTLLYGELLRIPSSSKRLRMLAGTAWVSQGGLDFVLGGGDCLDVPGTKGVVIISALRGEDISFELW